MKLQIKQIAHCTKCGEEILGDEDSLCGACSGEEMDVLEVMEDLGIYQDKDGAWIV